VDASYGEGHASYNIDALMKKLRKNRFTTKKWWKRHIQRCTKQKERETKRQIGMRKMMDEMKAKKFAETD